MLEELKNEFIAQSIFRLRENTPRIVKCLDRLTEEQVWQKPNKSLNSIGNLIIHLCGNINQYIVSSLGNRPDIRDRDNEFSMTGGFTKKELLEKLSSTVEEAVSVITKISEIDLLKIHSVQGFDLSGIAIIIHVTEHYSYHTGQIALLTKQFTNEDLGFYKGIDLNIKNK